MAVWVYRGVVKAAHYDHDTGKTWIEVIGRTVRISGKYGHEVQHMPEYRLFKEGNP